MSRGARASWHFEYAPLPQGGGSVPETDVDLVIATEDDVDPARLVELVGADVRDLAVTPLFSCHPVFWTRLESSSPIDVRNLAHAFARGGIAVRYITSGRRGSQVLPPPLNFDEARPRTGRDWAVRQPGNEREESSPWRWFVRPEGADVERAICGTGAGTRLAVIDNDGRELHRVNLDAEVLVGVESVPRAQAHAAMLVGWAVGAQKEDGTRFHGVAPDASPRVYCIPKPGEDVWSLPLAILRAVEDGADVIVCATYVEGTTSPLLDDALEVAVRLGRRGRGTAIVVPTGREMSSSEGSTNSSLSLALSDPGSDPRVFCVGPSARDGNWFLWRDRRGMLRPFANRGPAVRWLAPGDDMAYPFSATDRPAHAESSGASAVAGGVLLLLLGQCPELTLPEVETFLQVGAVDVDPARQSEDPALADRRDLEPRAVDRDHHNAKHGYGRVSAKNACLAALDPLAQVLLRIGEPVAAHRYVEERRAWHGDLASEALLHWSARAVAKDPGLTHSLAALLRGLRLHRREGAPDLDPHPTGTWLRQFGVFLRRLCANEPPAPLAFELRGLEARLRASDAAARDVEAELLAFAGRVLAPEPGAPSRVVELHDPRGRATAVSHAKAPGARH
jgi:hypothetical protein